jgi:hypothetical protein
MQVAKIFTFSFVAGQTITCTYWTYDRGTRSLRKTEGALNTRCTLGEHDAR